MINKFDFSNIFRIYEIDTFDDIFRIYKDISENGIYMNTQT